jgi:hypothetical protein
MVKILTNDTNVFLTLACTPGQWLLETAEWNEQTCRKMLWNGEWAASQLVGVSEEQFGAWFRYSMH